MKVTPSLPQRGRQPKGEHPLDPLLCIHALNRGDMPKGYMDEIHFFEIKFLHFQISPEMAIGPLFGHIEVLRGAR